MPWLDGCWSELHKEFDGKVIHRLHLDAAQPSCDREAREPKGAFELRARTATR